MHPTLMTLSPSPDAAALRSSAEAGRSEPRSRTRRRFLPHLPRRATQVAHV